MMNGVFEKKDIDIFVKKTDDFPDFEPMFHPHMEIIYVLSGCIRVNIDGVTKNIRKGQVSITFPYSVHSYKKVEDASAVLIMFSPSSVAGFEKILLTHKPRKPYIEADERLSKLLLRIGELGGGEDEISQKTLSGYIGAAVGEILMKLKFIDNESADIDALRKILIYCSAHYTEEISISSIAKALYVSQSYVTKVFSEKLKFPFREYINVLRISKAAKLLRHTDSKIMDIMYECGFQNQSSFNRVFLNIHNITPKEYREKYKKDNLN